MKSVLVVDDSEDSRFALARLLEIEGYRVLEAEDGERAVEAARNARPDMILMDLSLPGINGAEATRQIREDAALSRTPIIALSGYEQEECRALVEHAGFTSYLAKPVDFQALLAVVAQHLAA